MKKLLVLAGYLIISVSAFPQKTLSCADFSYLKKDVSPSLGIVIYSDDAETVWNALRLANYSQEHQDTVVIFLLGKGIDGFQKEDPKFDIAKMGTDFVSKGGQILACASCVKLRGKEDVQTCTVSSLADLYQIVNRSKRLLTF